MFTRHMGRKDRPGRREPPSLWPDQVPVIEGPTAQTWSVAWVPPPPRLFPAHLAAAPLWCAEGGGCDHTQESSRGEHAPERIQLLCSEVFWGMQRRPRVPTRLPPGPFSMETLTPRSRLTPAASYLLRELAFHSPSITSLMTLFIVHFAL